MKKVITILSVFVVAFTATVSAQLKATAPEPTALKVTMSDVMISSITMKEGANTIPVPEGRGSIQLIKRGDKFSGVVYTDAAGKSTRLTPNNGSTGNLPKPPCKYKLPDACFGSPGQNTAICICRPTDLASGPTDPYSISLLLPAVQSAREAARRAQ